MNYFFHENVTNLDIIYQMIWVVQKQSPLISVVIIYFVFSNSRTECLNQMQVVYCDYFPQGHDVQFTLKFLQTCILG